MVTNNLILARRCLSIKNVITLNNTIKTELVLEVYFNYDLLGKPTRIPCILTTTIFSVHRPAKKKTLGIVEIFKKK